MSKQSNEGVSFRNLFNLTAGLFYFFFVRPQLLRWGTRLGESQRRLPGDDLIPAPNSQATRAIDIDAPVEAVWPWLAQMGRDRTGWYGLDLLFNNGIPSATYLRRDLAEPTVGMALDLGLRVLAVEKKRLLLIGGFELPNPLGTSTDATTLFYLERKSDGGTRLLVRRRAFAYGVVGKLYSLAHEPLDFVMVYQQLKAIKSHAETMAHLQIPVPLEHEISLN